MAFVGADLCVRPHDDHYTHDSHPHPALRATFPLGGGRLGIVSLRGAKRRGDPHPPSPEGKGSLVERGTFASAASGGLRPAPLGKAKAANAECRFKIYRAIPTLVSRKPKHLE